MRRLGAIAVVALCALPAAHGDQPIALTPNVIHALTPIDSIPTKDELQTVLPVDTVSRLAQIALDGTVDFGVRLRAIRALPQFCPVGSCARTIPHDTVRALIEGSDPAEHSGQPVLLLRAAIEALGAARSGDPNDVAVLVPFLDNTSRDIRAASARALRDLCNSQAIVPLRTRYLGETVPQVRLAISAALRDLAQCSQ
ncbi:MAG: HEAT repeat domain-containing protein [Deltaproteobacteria bacterium]|nr:HEAT repeat domain-containing protein [Deltaproteobacteria bacterium]